MTTNKIFWLYGRSGAGKTTLAKRLRNGLADRKIPFFVLDGDDIRSGLCSDLGFTSEARLENHRRIAEVAWLAAEQGFNVIVSSMAPEHKQRDVVKQRLALRLTWIYIHALLNVCIERDPKGLYKKAHKGEIKGLVEFPFDAPRPGECENRVDTIAQSVEGCYQTVREIVFKELTDYAI